MTQRVALQMDDIRHINFHTDSSLLLGLEAQARGYELYYYQPQDLFYEQGRVKAFVSPIKLYSCEEKWYELGSPKAVDLVTQMDIVFMRQDPPFDMAYITACHLLEKIHPQTLVLNHPAHVRSCPEKIFVTQFPELMPDTLIGRRVEDIEKFYRKHGQIILKPLFGRGGEEVFLLEKDDKNLLSLCELMFSVHREPIIAQQYLPQVKKGDRRIILINGKPIGGFDRVPQKGQIRSNLCLGGSMKKADLSSRDHHICQTLEPFLKEFELMFVGIDVIGGYLTEINVTSPTGLSVLNSLNGIKSEKIIWDEIDLIL